MILSKLKITLLFIMLSLFGVYYIISSPYRMHRVEQYLSPVEKKTPRLRAKIVTDDNVTLAYSEYVYHLSFLGEAYSKEEFKNLLDAISQVAKIDTATAMKRYSKNSNKEYKIVLFGLNKQRVEKIKAILKQKDPKNKYAFTLSGERRIYPQGDTLTPVIGYTKKWTDKNNFTYRKGASGIESSYEYQLSNLGILRKVDTDLYINFQMQKTLEKEMDELKALYDAREVISVLIDTDTFHIKAFASSNRYNPNDIKEKDISNLSVHAIQYLFRIDEFSPLYNYGLYENIGLEKPSGIDLAHERTVQNKDELRTYKVNFMQLVKAFSPFYSGGYIATPIIAKDFLKDEEEKQQFLSKTQAAEAQKKANALFGEMPGKNVTLEFEDKTVTAAVYMKSFRQGGHNYMKAYFTVFNEYKIPFKVVVHSEVSSSSQYFEATIYSKKDKHKIGTVIQPINRYQAYKRHGSESDIVGIYKSIDGNYYIDAITDKMTMLASCNACQTYNVETFQVTDRKLISKGLRVYDIDHYTPYVECCK